ncbi:GNAT family N-acetyltransferase [Nocardioides coralli]|uniref:GNAT family N-acetyltransferase n=1 Tax=Nocardioides coralli TaxID=2872154 RepID=UPI001CA39AEB|nr:GNAT family N-acetyltransferase [Nocardioides coralli]QZY29271.1 GNAT family N-acetyltransferase [Nocardioides coralli]
MTLPERIATARLRLVLVTPQDAADMRAGRRQDRWHPAYPRTDDVDAATLVRADDPWGPRHVVLGHEAVGTIGCFGPPEDGEVEVGLGLVEPVRRQGVASEALRGLAAATDALGVRLRATVAPTNTAALRLLAGCGFTQLRPGTPEGELVMARPLPDGG